MTSSELAGTHLRLSANLLPLFEFGVSVVPVGRPQTLVTGYGYWLWLWLLVTVTGVRFVVTGYCLLIHLADGGRFSSSAD